MKKIEIYTSPTCIHCTTLKKWLKENKFKYLEHNVYTDEKARDFIVKKSNQMGVPVTLISNEDGANEQIVIGFEKEQLASILGLESK